MQILKQKHDAFACMFPNLQEKGSSTGNDSTKNDDDSSASLTSLENSLRFDESFNESNTSFLVSSANHFSASSLPLIMPPSEKSGVRFNEDKNKRHSTNFTLEDLKSWREELWYSKEECQHFQETTKCLGKQFVRSKSAYGAILRRVYSKACSSSSNEDNVAGEDDADNDQRQQQQDHVSLKNILKMSSMDKLVGLERKITRGLSQHVMAQKMAINNVVIRGKEQGVVDNGGDNNKADQIRKACEDRSRSSRLFALYLAKALAASIEEEEEEDMHFL